MTITRTGVWGAGTAVLCILLLTGAWFVVVGPQRAEADQTRLTTESTRAQNGQLEQRIAELETEFALLPQRRAELQAIREALPADPALAALLDELDVIATGTGARLDSVVAGSATTLVDAVVPPAPSAGSEETDSAAAGSGTAQPDQQAGQQVVTEAVPASPRRLATGAVPGGQDATSPAVAGTTEGSAAVPPILAAIPVTITVGGDFFAAASFVETVQSDLVRAFVVDSVDVVTGTDEDGSVVATLTGRVFVFVDPQAVDALGAADSTTAGPAAGSTDSSTTGPEATDD